MYLFLQVFSLVRRISMQKSGPNERRPGMLTAKLVLSRDLILNLALEQNCIISCKHSHGGPLKSLPPPFLYVFSLFVSLSLIHISTPSSRIFCKINHPNQFHQQSSLLVHSIILLLSALTTTTFQPSTSSFAPSSHQFHQFRLFVIYKHQKCHLQRTSFSPPN